MKAKSVLLTLILTHNVWALDALPSKPVDPKDNPTTPAKVELGKKLFFDPRISQTGTVSCNSCHNVMAGGVDNTKFSTGIEGKKGGRNAPTVWNAAFHSVQFWDGRAKSLEAQAIGPMVNPVEMGMPNHDAVIARLQQIPGYVKEFDSVFGKNSLNISNVAKAIAAYERTLVTPGSAYDRFVKGDKSALNAQQKRGLQLVQTHGCVSCHMGANFAGPNMPEGTGFYQKFPAFPGSDYDSKYDLTADKGRYEVTKQDADKHMFRVQTWRNIALTAPYFHNGSVKTLDEAVRVMAKTQLNKELPDQDVKDIVAFLNSLSGPFPKQTMPKLPDYTNGSLVE